MNLYKIDHNFILSLRLKCLTKLFCETKLKALNTLFTPNIKKKNFHLFTSKLLLSEKKVYL